MKKEDIIWVAWEKHRRTLELCKYLSVRPYIFDRKSHRLIRYLENIFKTIMLLYRKKTSVLFIQNPSIVLATISCLLKKVFGYYLIVDAHNSGIIPDIDLLKRFGFIYRYIQKTADITIVTNQALADLVDMNNGNSFILPDIIPSLPDDTFINESKVEGIKITNICSFHNDEPYLEILKAASHLPDYIKIYMTGDYSKLSKKILFNLPNQVILTGYVNDSDYWKHIKSSHIIMDLTFRENCLLCGAYEGVAACKPLILSDTKALKEYFYKGVCYTKNNSDDIQSIILFAVEKIDELNQQINDLKYELLRSWSFKGEELKLILRTQCNRHKIKQAV